MNIDKYEAIGNDYLVGFDEKFSLSPNDIAKLCHRNFGIGADGILYGTQISNDVFNLTIYNSDGSIAEKSGNGVRIFAKYLLDHNIWTSGSIKIHTVSDVCECINLGDKIGVNMGRPRYISTEQFLKSVENISIGQYNLTLNCVSMGNPHCVIFLDEVSKDIACEFGPIIEKLPIFPQKTNVQFVKVINENLYNAEIWERGSGYTLSSGSSSCGIFAIAQKLGLVNDKLTVQMPGGELNMEMRPSGEIMQYGIANRIAKCEVFCV